MDLALLSPEHIAWVDAYHEMCREVVLVPLLDAHVKKHGGEAEEGGGKYYYHDADLQESDEKVVQI